MCGIAGVVRRDGAMRRTRRAALGAALAHRGPDGRGVWRSPAQTRCSSTRGWRSSTPGRPGAQPMATADGRHRIVFNGEVYNYRERRAALEARGERFTTGSDTEVLLRLLVCDGPAALAQLRGMFALGWWDAEARALVLARDRFGIKPLYVAAADTSIAFASEIHAL
jgi:asparagine synthase (glutamine-hydrolysing)